MYGYSVHRDQRLADEALMTDFMDLSAPLTPMITFVSVYLLDYLIGLFVMRVQKHIANKLINSPPPCEVEMRILA